MKGLKQGISLRIVNLLGLSVIFACMVLSYLYVKHEFSYDRFHTRADRIVRLSMQYDDNPIDVRMYGFMPAESPLTADIPEIEQVVRLFKVNTAVIVHDAVPHIVNNVYFASSGFFDVFDFKLLEGDVETALNAPGKVAISRRLADELFAGKEAVVGQQIALNGERMMDGQGVVVSAVFEDFPVNSHFHTDMLIGSSDDMVGYSYVYLLLNAPSSVQRVREKIEGNTAAYYKDSPMACTPLVMPLTDIHLHSNCQREHEVNGNISYIYMIAGINILLLIVVLCNLWLNSGLLFSYNRRLYQILRLNGASAMTVVRNEFVFSLLLVLMSILLGSLLVALFGQPPGISFRLLAGVDVLWGIPAFSILALLVYMLPVLGKLHTTLFRYAKHDVDRSRLSFFNIKYMLLAQFVLVMFIVVVAFAIHAQMNLIRTSSVGGEATNILVLKEQPDKVKEHYELLKAELLKHPEIEAVTAAMQLPGDDIRDGMLVWTEHETPENARGMNILVGDDNLLPFFDIHLLAGRYQQPLTLTYREEKDFVEKRMLEKSMIQAAHDEEYLINRRAVEVLGFKNPEEAVGKYIHFDHQALGYIKGGRICGVVEDFNYTNVYYAPVPLLVMSRRFFLHCIMVRLQPGKEQEGLEVFNRVWNGINPDYPASYSFMHDVYRQLYHNEMNMEALVNIFSALCILLANLGLIIFMAFIVKRRTKEIGIRKVNGATSMEIVRMLNGSFLIWICVSFFIALPFAYIVLHKWLESFAYRITLSWWMFLSAGLSVVLVSVICVSWMSWRASVVNPTEAVNRE